MIAFTVAGCSDRAADRSADRAAAQVHRIADELDAKTTDAGVYVRANDGDIRDVDPWGIRIRVTYSQGGVAEVISVRSAGPDREFYTADDIATERMAANFKGIGAGIRLNAEETAANAARGAVKGVIQGAKESLRDSLPKRWSQPQHEAAPRDAITE